jgi:hypothetical protein
LGSDIGLRIEHDPALLDLERDSLFVLQPQLLRRRLRQRDHQRAANLANRQNVHIASPVDGAE